MQCRVDYLGNTLVIMGAGSSRALFVMESFEESLGNEL